MRLEHGVLEEPAAAERVHDVPDQRADLDVAREPRQDVPQVAFVVAPVEEEEAGHEGGGQDQDALGVPEGVADEKPRRLGDG